MRRIHIVGSKNHGKTTLLVELIDAATRRGLGVGAIKHTHHSHEVDRRGSDSHRLREAGATTAAFVAGSSIGIFLPRGSGPCYQQLEALYTDCDLVLVEGHLDAGGTTIEVWRSAIGTVPIALDNDGIAAVITDDPLDLDLPILPRADPERLLDHVLSLAGIPTNSNRALEEIDGSSLSIVQGPVRPLRQPC